MHKFHWWHLFKWPFLPTLPPRVWWSIWTIDAAAMTVNGLGSYALGLFEFSSDVAHAVAAVFVLLAVTPVGATANRALFLRLPPSPPPYDASLSKLQNAQRLYAYCEQYPSSNPDIALHLRTVIAILETQEAQERDAAKGE